jgi:hypothetical protein
VKPDEHAALLRDLHATVPEAKKFGYNPARFAAELQDEPSPEALVYRYLFGKDHVTDGFARLAAEHRLDLSVEYIAWKHSPPLPPAVKRRAAWRLDEAGFDERQRQRYRQRGRGA